MSMRETIREFAGRFIRKTVVTARPSNAGLRNATGVYYKVVDSDDWVNEEAYMEVLDTLRKFVHDNVTLDMLITNFVYEKQGAKHKKVMNYNMAASQNASSSTGTVRGFRLGQYILMHSGSFTVWKCFGTAAWNCQSIRSTWIIFLYISRFHT